MSKKTFKKKIVFSSIIGFFVNIESGQPVSMPLKNEIAFTKLNVEKAKKLLQKKYPEKTILVDAVEQHEKEYEMSYDDFMKYAIPVSNEQENNPTN